jgi:hypothetical protein
MLKQDHTGKFPLQDFLSSHIGLDDTRVIGAQDGKQVVNAGLCRIIKLIDVTCEWPGRRPRMRRTSARASRKASATTYDGDRSSWTGTDMSHQAVFTWSAGNNINLYRVCWVNQSGPAENSALKEG